ncbi:MAG: hypothetical protein AAF990_25270 [Bacteroidota bacterium]
MLNAPRSLKYIRRVVRNWRGLRKVPLLLSAVLLFYTLNLSAQAPRDTLIKEISIEIMDLITANINQHWEMEGRGGLWQLDSLFNQRKTNVRKGSQLPIFDKKISELKKDVGLDIKGQYFYNHDPLFDFTDGDIGQQFYSSRLRAGVEWQILREGFLGHRNSAKQLQLRRQIKGVEEMIDSNDDDLYYRYNLFIYFFNRAKIELLRQRRYQLETELDLLHKVYYLKGILYEVVINARSRLEQINVKVENYESYNRLIDSTLFEEGLGIHYDVRELPVLEIDLDRLVQDNQRQELVDSLDRMYRQVEVLKQNPVHDLSLKVGFYHNTGFERDDGVSDRTFSTWNLSFSIPTNALFQKKSREEMVVANTEYRDQFNRYELLNNKTEVINYYYEYQYKLQQYIEFMHKEMLYREKIRVEAVTQRDYVDIFRSLQTLKYLDVLRQIQLEMLDLKQQMYLLLLKIYGKSHRRSILPFIANVNIADYYERLPANRTLLLAQKDLHKYNSYFIKNYMLSNDFEKLIIRTSSTAIHPDIQKLRTLLEESAVEVHVMTDNRRLVAGMTKASDNINGFLKQKQLDGLVVNLNSARMGLGADSLPQYLQNLKSQTFDIHAISDAARAKIAVQVPLDFPHLAQLNWCSMVSIRLETEQALDAFAPLVRQRLIDPMKIHLVVEASRFKDRVELEGFIDEAVNQYKIKNIVIEGLSEFITLDAKALVAPE